MQHGDKPGEVDGGIWGVKYKGGDLRHRLTEVWTLPLHKPRPGTTLCSPPGHFPLHLVPQSQYIEKRLGSY